MGGVMDVKIEMPKAGNGEEPGDAQEDRNI